MRMQTRTRRAPTRVPAPSRQEDTTTWRRFADPLRIGVAGQILVTITAIQTYMGPVNNMRPALLFMVLGLWGVYRYPRQVAWKNLSTSWVPKGVLGILLLACGSAIFGLSLGGSAVYILNHYWKTLASFFLLVVAIRDARDLRFFIWTYALSIGILVVLSLTVMDVNVTNDGLGRLAGTGMFDANDLGMLFVMGLPLTFMLVYNSSTATAGWIARAILVGIAIGIVLTGSRGAIVGLAVVAPIMLVVLKRIALWNRVLAVGTVAVVLAVAAPPGYWEQMGTMFQPEDDYNYTDEYGRVAVAKRGMGYMAARPFFGVGINNFDRAEGTISPIAEEQRFEGEALRWISPHNTFVQIGAELGVGGLLLWLALLYGASIGLWKLRRRMPRRWDHAGPDRRFLRELTLFFPVAVIGFASTSFFLTHAYSPPGYMLFGIAAGIQALIVRERSRVPSQGPLRTGRQAMPRVPVTRLSRHSNDF